MSVTFYFEYFYRRWKYLFNAARSSKWLAQKFQSCFRHQFYRWRVNILSTYFWGLRRILNRSVWIGWLSKNWTSISAMYQRTHWTIRTINISFLWTRITRCTISENWIIPNTTAHFGHMHYFREWFQWRRRNNIAICCTPVCRPAWSILRTIQTILTIPKMFFRRWLLLLKSQYCQLHCSCIWYTSTFSVLFFQNSCSSLC